MEKILNYINGDLVEPVNGHYFDNYNKKYGNEHFNNENDHFYYLYNYTSINKKKNFNKANLIGYSAGFF